MEYRVWWNGEMYYPGHDEEYYFFYLNQRGELREFEHPTYDAEMTPYPDAVKMFTWSWTDQEGAPIYEGDIYEDGTGYVSAVGSMVEFSTEVIEHQERYDEWLPGNITIIGNVHENKELCDE